MDLQIIQNKIFEIRGYRVMLDFHLAELYGVQTKALKQAVKRNEKRFPPDFRFTMTKEEWDELVTNCDQLPESLKHSYILPDCFTEQGVAPSPYPASEPVEATERTPSGRFRYL